MNEIKVSLDSESFRTKPTDSEVGKMSLRIGKNVKVLNSIKSIQSFVLKVGQQGHSFSPATFSNGLRRVDNFEQMQLLVLDFDGKISFESVCERAKEHELPMLAAYDTFSSTNHNRFRIIFLNNIPIKNIKAAKIYKGALMEIFPESDKTDSDISKMYYGGKELLYFNKSLLTIDLESTLKNMTYFLKNKYGATHYKRHLKEFAKKYGIRLNKKGLLDVSTVNNDTEAIGTSDDGKNSPKSFIFYKDNGEFLPKSYYQLHYEDDGTQSSVEKYKKNHEEYRSEIMSKIACKCQLYREFKTGKRRLHHDELFGISTNLMHVETGINTFKDILSRYPDYYDALKRNKWNFYVKYNKDQNYSPKKCNMFCAYKDICNHGTNILSTVKPKRGEIERLDNYIEVYHSIEEVQEDLVRNLTRAVYAKDKLWHVIKAQTAAGKTEAYLRIMKTQEGKFLIVVPTNKLKWDVKKRADKMGIDIMVSPSLDEISDEMPEHIWEHIKFLRDTGQHTSVHSFISRMAEEENVICLKRHLKKQKEFESYVGNTITTHRKFLNMDKKTLDKYDVVIIDEDIILSSIIPNQCEIPISVLKKVLKKAEKEVMKSGVMKGTYSLLVKKIKRLLYVIKDNTLFKLSGFEWDRKEDNDIECEKDDVGGIAALTDIPSFCLSEYFVYRKASEEKNLSEDSIVFLKPYKFKNIKHIMVSATVDKDICEYCFGKQNVKFYACKQANYTGTLNQYFEKPMSRHCIDEDTSILKRISDWSGFKHMITFKKYSIGDMYFGNAIGCDYLKGQNINVVGTPYQVDFLYKLFPFSLGLDIDENAKMKSCRVSHNGYIFTFTTYGEEHDVLRKFHFWMIESELEQAVGRARLLRCNCTVNLFSGFPLRQAIMKKSEYDNNTG